MRKAPKKHSPGSFFYLYFFSGITHATSVVIAKIILIMICLAPVGVLIPQLHLQRRRRHLTAKSPFTDLLLRPAGEGLRIKLGKLDEKLNNLLLWSLGFPVMLAGVLFVALPSELSVLSGLVFTVPILVFFVGGSFFIFGRKLPKLFREISDHELGFQGERYVGEMLNQLHGKGFRVFHDLPFDDFNIDHFIVGPQGAYAIETKTRRKPIGDNGKAAHKVIFDGGCLYFPHGKDRHGLEQAKRNADYLSSWLSSATGERVKVEPILTLPGWWIDRTGHGSVHVVNTKEIPKIFDGNPAVLTLHQIQRISHQVEQKCRNLKA